MSSVENEVLHSGKEADAMHGGEKVGEWSARPANMTINDSSIQNEGMRYQNKHKK